MRKETDFDQPKKTPTLTTKRLTAGINANKVYLPDNCKEKQIVVSLLIRYLLNLTSRTRTHVVGVRSRFPFSPKRPTADC